MMGSVDGTDINYPNPYQENMGMLQRCHIVLFFFFIYLRYLQSALRELHVNCLNAYTLRGDAIQ